MKQYVIAIFLIVATLDGLLAQQDASVLFIGNSLTYTHDLPRLVKEEAQHKGYALTTATVAKPNYALMDHWADGKIQKLMRINRYDYVVIQQGPSSQNYGRQLLIDYAQKLAELCEKYEGQLVIFMVWPSRTYYHTYDNVIRSHQLAADAAGAILCPVGEVWKSRFDNTNNFDYYGPDGFHPSLKGSKVAAEIIVETLFNYEH